MWFGATGSPELTHPVSPDQSDALTNSSSDQSPDQPSILS